MVAPPTTQPEPVEAQAESTPAPSEPVPSKPAPSASSPLATRPQAQPRPVETHSMIQAAPPQTVETVRPVLREEMQQELREAHPIVQATTPSTRQSAQMERGAIESVTATQHIVEAAPRAVTTAEARPVVGAATEVAVTQSTMAPLQTPVATAVGGPAGVVTRELVHTGGPASTAHGEPIQSVARQPVLASSASSSVRAFYAQSASQSVIETEPVSEVVEERLVTTALPSVLLPMKTLPVRAMPGTKANYGWLADDLRHRIEQEKRYPRLARMHGWGGRVVILAVIKDDGSLQEASIAESSGHEALDQDAIDLLKRISPMKLKHALGQPQVVVQIPIHYRMEE